MDCGGSRLCGVLALEMGTGTGYYSHPHSGVHGLWPQVAPYGNSQCVHPTISSSDPSGLAACYKPQGTESASHQLSFEKHEWEKHGMCAGVQSAKDYFSQICRLAQRPVEIMDGVRASGGSAVDAADQLQRSGYCVWSVASHAQVYLSACAGSDGVWKLADSASFASVCGAPSPPPPAPWAAACLPNTRGPACHSDWDCAGITGCVRCAKSGFCTNEPAKTGMCVSGKHGPRCHSDADCDGVPGCVRCAKSGFCTNQH